MYGTNSLRTIARRGADSTHRAVGQRRMNGISIAATVGRARLVVVIDIGVVIGWNEHSSHAIVTPAIPRNLPFARWAVRHIRSRTSSIREALVDGARVLVIAIRIVDTGRRLRRRLGAVRFECARCYLRCGKCRAKNHDECGEDARTQGHRILVFPRSGHHATKRDFASREKSTRSRYYGVQTPAPSQFPLAHSFSGSVPAGMGLQVPLPTPLSANEQAMQS